MLNKETHIVCYFEMALFASPEHFVKLQIICFSYDLIRFDSQNILRKVF